MNNNGTIKIQNTIYNCPIHGDVKDIITVYYPKSVGNYCQECWVEKSIIGLGIPKVNKVEQPTENT